MALLKEDIRYREILNKISNDLNILIFILDEDLLISHINEKVFQKMLGFSENEVLGKNFLDFVEPSEKERVRNMLGEISQEKEKKLNITLKHKEFEPLVLKSTIRYLEEGDSHNWILISSYKTNKKQEYDQNHLRILFESLRDIIFVVEYKGDIVTFNTIALKKLKYPEKELLNKKFIELHPLESRDKVENFLEEIFHSKRDSYSIPLVTKDEKKIPVEIMVTRGLWNEKPVFFGICRDISERLEYERLIEEELKKLMQLDKIRKDLISRVSHELKTPLMNIRGATELMTDFYGEKLTEELKELVQIIKKGESRLEYLVNNLLDISRIQYKKLTINRKPTNITKLIKDCCQDMKSFIRKRNINLKLNLYEDLIINVDKGRIEQVIKNLISNAIKNSPPDEEIEIITKKSDELLEIMVDDNGVGLTQEEKKKLFKRFGKIERYEKGLEYLNIQGSGLGLYISKKIIDLHNGSIIAKSDGRNKGATFVIQIPIKNI